MHLSTHFTLAELEFSDIAIRHGIDNHCPKILIPSLERLCHFILEPVRERFGAVKVTSGYRCAELNRLLKSRGTSQHVRAEAADFVIVCGPRPMTVCDWIVNEGLPFHQLIHEYGRWAHASIAPPETDPKREVLTIDRSGCRSGLHEVVNG